MEKPWVVVEEEYNVSIFPYIYGWMGWTHGLMKHIGVVVKQGLFEFRRDKLRVCLKPDEFLAVSKVVLERLEDPAFLEYAKKEITNSAKSLLAQSEKVFKADLSGMPNEALLSLFLEYGRLSVELYGAGFLCTASDVEFELLTKKNIRNLEGKAEKAGMNPGEAFSLLSVPAEESNARLEEMDFLRIAAEVEKIGKKRGAPPQKKIEKIIEDHAEKFGWLSFHYHGPITWTKGHYKKELEAFVNSGKDAEKELKELEKKGLATKKRHEELMDKMQLTEVDRYWLEVARQMIFYKGFRKEALIKSHYYIDKLMREIAKRLKVSVEYARYILPEEMPVALLRNDFVEKELKKRYEFCITITEGERNKVFVGKEAEDISKTIKEHVSNELRGSCACPGTARGIVKIVAKAEDVPKVVEGDILVSSMTNPNLVTAMKKAAAIVTDMGGIACHAAIVSRELGIPCVIGTKVATKLLKDGDEVEVDATNGVVKKL